MFCFLIMSLLINSCSLNDYEIKDFPCDCYVYYSDVIDSSFGNFRLLRIDPESKNECAKSQLQNDYLLYCNSACVNIYTTHLKGNFPLIEYYIKAFQSDSTNLSSFEERLGGIELTMSRKFKNIYTKEDYKNESYVDYERVELEWSAGKWMIKKTTFLNANLWMSAE